VRLSFVTLALLNATPHFSVNVIQAGNLNQLTPHISLLDYLYLLNSPASRQDITVDAHETKQTQAG
jgi:hypothetical protein